MERLINALTGRNKNKKKAEAAAAAEKAKAEAAAAAAAAEKAKSEASAELQATDDNDTRKTLTQVAEKLENGKKHDDTKKGFFKERIQLGRGKLSKQDSKDSRGSVDSQGGDKDAQVLRKKLPVKIRQLSEDQDNWPIPIEALGHEERAADLVNGNLMSPDDNNIKFVDESEESSLDKTSKESFDEKVPEKDEKTVPVDNNWSNHNDKVLPTYNANLNGEAVTNRTRILSRQVSTTSNSSEPKPRVKEVRISTETTVRRTTSNARSSARLIKQDSIQKRNGTHPAITKTSKTGTNINIQRETKVVKKVSNIAGEKTGQPRRLENKDQEGGRTTKTTSNRRPPGNSKQTAKQPIAPER